MEQNCSTCKHFYKPQHVAYTGCNADAEEGYDTDDDKDAAIGSWIDRHGPHLPLLPGCARLTTAEPCPGWAGKLAPKEADLVTPLRHPLVFSVGCNVTADLLRRASEAGSVQPHRFVSLSVPDPFQGDHEERDRLTAAFVEIFYLDQEVKRRAQAIFARHGFADEGFSCSVAFEALPKEAP